MLITVIVPYWNAERYIRRCIESLQEQEGEFEFILVNDGSEDRSRYEAIWRTEGDPRFKLIDNQRSSGVSGARNTGIDISSGEWITFLDADDIMLPDAFRKFNAAINHDPNADVHQFNHVRYYTTKNAHVIKHANGAGKFRFPYMPSWWFSVWNKLFHADFIKDIRFNESLNYGEDGMFVLDCMIKGAYIHHGGKGVTTVEHIFENRQSLSHSKKCSDIIKQIRTYLDYIERNDDPQVRSFICKKITDQLSDPALVKVICNEEV